MGPGPDEALRNGLASRHIPTLDGLRAIAVLLVVLYHAHTHAPGRLGVVIFFVLSGFLITWLLLKERDTSGAISLRAFYRRRCLRIFPAFYVYWLIVTTASFLHDHSIPVGQAVASFFYLGNYYLAFWSDPNSELSHTWSLGIEEQFYAIWPLCFLLLGRDLKRMAKALAIGIICVWTYRAVLLSLHVNSSYLYFAFDPRADQLMEGCLLAVLLRSEYAHEFVRRICFSAAAPFMSAAGLLVSSALGALYQSAYRDSVGFLVEPLMVACLLAQVIAYRDRMPWRWLNWKPVEMIGQLSYSIYLYHPLALVLVMFRMRAYPYAVQLVAALAVVLALSMASYYLIERPARNLKPSRKLQPFTVLSATKAPP